MPQCTVCDEALQPEQKTCHVCGSTVEATAPAASASASWSPSPPPLPPMPLPPLESIESDHSVDDRADPAHGERECPACGLTFGATHQDEFCSCGTELQARASSSTTPTGPSSPPAVSLPPIPSPPVLAPVELSGTTRPPVGTVCLVVYSDTKPRQPVRYFPLNKDVVVLGREDAVRGDFPDLDLGSLVDESLSRKVSRRHAEVLRARDTQTFSLLAFPGNTGTQVGKELAHPGQSYPLTEGTPIVLGGVIWLKFETIK